VVVVVSVGFAGAFFFATGFGPTRMIFGDER
jgi:hypothetical protein